VGVGCRRHGRRRNSVRALAPLRVVALFWLGHQTAVVTAHEQYARQRESDYNAFPRIQVWPKDGTKSPEGSPRASTDLTSGCYRLLLHNQSRLFLLRPFKGAPGCRSASADTAMGPGRADRSAARVHQP
jgi:hypothetical protein